ncbi:MAG: zf-HC2 domain-containing protein [Chloroflexota bacterium]
MARARADHSFWRGLIAARLDRPLSRSETRALATHLRDCASCHQADHDYREQRVALRGLPQKPAPRDLWPRTSAALDREIARGSYRRVRLWRGMSGRAPAPSSAIATTIAALGLIAAVGVMQLMPALNAAPTTAPGQATAFAVSPQQLVFMGSEAADLYIYQTHVGHVCPPVVQNCSVDDGVVRTQVNLPSSVRARNAALSPSGQAFAIVGRDLNRDLIAVVILPPNGSPAKTPDSSQPGADPSNTPDGPAESAAPSGAADETPGSQPSDVAEATPSGPPASAVAGLQVLSILENVQSAGAPPQWSPSGAMLAFSAMPADGSHGPDVYVWSPSDSVALPITTDHSSYFASWSGERIVASRVVAKADSDTPQMRTVVIDPSTLEERVVAGPALWLPVVNPARTLAIAWRGDLDVANGLALPRSGSLGMVDWTALDPFARGNEPQPTEVPTDSPTASPAPPTVAPSPTPAASAPASAQASAATPSASPTDGSKAPPSDAPATPVTNAEPSAPPAGWSELGLGRNPEDAPVVDWQVRWSLDGQVLGVWIADAEGTTWGRLTVLAVDPETNDVATSDPLLAPALARRGFSLGLSRVAWVAPADDNPDGQLRVRTWGVDGTGDLRLLPDQLEEVVPAF